MKTLLLAVAVLLVAMLVGLAGCGEARQGGFDYVAEPRRVPKPKTCSDYANAHEILIDERASKLTKADKQWLDMDGDGQLACAPLRPRTSLSASTLLPLRAAEA